MGVLANIVYEVNATGEIVYYYGQPQDIIEVQKLYVRNAAGNMVNTTSVNIGTTDLYTYTVTYQDNHGIDFPDPENPDWMGLIMVVAVVLLVGMMTNMGKRRR